METTQFNRKLHNSSSTAIKGHRPKQHPLLLEQYGTTLKVTTLKRQRLILLVNLQQSVTCQSTTKTSRVFLPKLIFDIEFLHLCTKFFVSLKHGFTMMIRTMLFSQRISMYTGWIETRLLHQKEAVLL